MWQPTHLKINPALLQCHLKGSSLPHRWQSQWSPCPAPFSSYAACSSALSPPWRCSPPHHHQGHHPPRLALWQTEDSSRRNLGTENKGFQGAGQQHSQDWIQIWRENWETGRTWKVSAATCWHPPSPRVFKLCLWPFLVLIACECIRGEVADLKARILAQEVRKWHPVDKNGKGGKIKEWNLQRPFL